MPQVDIPIDEIRSGENCSLTSSAGTVASQSLSSDDSRPSSGANWQLSSTTQFNDMVMPSTQSRPNNQRQTNLIDALKYAVGTNEMATMTQIHLLLSSTMFGLHRLNVFLPSLTVLNLDGSSLDSLRDLGSELNIKYLNVSRCGLRSLDGINGMHLVEQLVADINKIENVLPLSNLSELQCLSLKGNRIKGREALSCLSLCVRLVELRLQDNPIAKPVGYRQFVGSIVPNLLIVDGMSVGGNKSIFADQNDLAELSSSVSSSLSRDIDTTNSSNNNSLHEIDPLSSIERNSETVLLTRPSKADPFSDANRSLRHSDAIVGNIIDKARRQRRHQMKNRPSTSSSVSDSNSSNGTNASTGRRFSTVLPQSIVELELGIVEIQNQTPSLPLNSMVSADEMPCGDEVTVELLTAARKWREMSQRSRSTGVPSKK